MRELARVTDQRCLADCDTSPWYTLFCGGDYKMRYTLGAVLLDAGFDANYQHSKDMQDVYTRFPKILRFLPIDSMLFYKCIRPLTKASYFESALHPSRLVQLLLDRGAYVNAQSLYELAPIIPALENAKSAVVEKLLRHGAEVDIYHPKIQGNLSLLLSLHRWKSFNFLLKIGVETQSLFCEAKYLDCLEQYKHKLKQWRQNKATNQNAAAFIKVTDHNASSSHSSGSTNQNASSSETLNQGVAVDVDHTASRDIAGGGREQQDIIDSMSFLPFTTFLMAARQVMSGGPYHVTIGQVLYRLVYYSPTVNLSSDVMSYMDSSDERDAIAALTETPRCLDHLCRMRVRQAIGPHRLYDRKQVRQALSLPANIVDYLYFKEFEDDS